MQNITILAAGTWGTALAQILSKKNQVTLWTSSPEKAESLKNTKRHPNLPRLVLSDDITFTADLGSAVSAADIVIIAVPSPFVRDTAEKIQSYLSGNQILVCVSKGLEQNTFFTMSEVIQDVLHRSNPVAVLSGPTHAEEVALEQPTLIVCASEDLNAAETVQQLFSGTCIRPYTNEDIKGVELCGALKNIIALACGIASGLGYGDNTRAAIITRGMSEIKNLGIAMGCLENTFAGLAGIGDLIVTATSQHSRNNRAGQYIGEGCSPETAAKKVGMVVEGINALPAAVRLGNQLGIELPIITSVDHIVNKGVSAKEEVDRLFSRNLRAETGKCSLKLQSERELLNR